MIKYIYIIFQKVIFDKLYKVQTKSLYVVNVAKNRAISTQPLHNSRNIITENYIKIILTS